VETRSNERVISRIILPNLMKHDNPLFHVKQKSSQRQYIVLEFLRVTESYLLICKPCPKTGTGAQNALIEDDIYNQAKNPSIPEEVLTANECEFSLFSQFLNYSIIARKMMHRGVTCNDLKAVNFPQEHLDLIKAFTEARRE
jgi:hypothetical protein